MMLSPGANVMCLDLSKYLYLWKSSSSQRAIELFPKSVLPKKGTLDYWYYFMVLCVQDIVGVILYFQFIVRI